MTTKIFIDLLLFVDVFVALFLTLLVLMQRPKNEGLGTTFGGGMTDSLFGTQTTNVLGNLTRWLGGIFFAVSLLLSYLYAHGGTGGSATQKKLQALPVPIQAATPAPVLPSPAAATPAPAPTAPTTPEGAATPAPAGATPTPAGNSPVEAPAAPAKAGEATPAPATPASPTAPATAPAPPTNATPAPSTPVAPTATPAPAASAPTASATPAPASKPQ